ncbi:hypothetical protein [Amycolatopsis sp. GM8]|uniref:hypothetical protein n=1 Tax=Amycolatopsis sp. GM8 TaxID=2896530 RepID=UPI001F48D8BC|nr:hypothetical protein [Amycolatopsis sp. GM8]
MDTRERRSLVVSVAARPHAAPSAAVPMAAPVVAQPRPRRFRKPVPGQILCWQIAIVLATMAARQPWPTAALAVAGAGVLVAASVARYRGRRLYQVMLLQCRSVLRARRHRVPDGSGLLRLLMPGSVARDVETGQGPVVTISHVEGLTAILRPRTVTKLLLSSFPAPGELLAAAGVPWCEVQTVFHAPARHDRAAGIWLAVSIARTPGMATDDELILLLHKGLHRIQQVLERSGVRTGPMDSGAALTAITGLAHIGGGRQELRQSWRLVRTRGVVQACFLLDGQDRADLQRLVGTLLTRYPGVAVTATRSARAGETSTLLRLAAATETAVDAAATHAAHLLSPTGIHLTRLDGAQLAGLAASLPIGGFPR